MKSPLIPSPLILEATIDDAEAVKAYLTDLFNEPERFSPTRPEEHHVTLDEQRQTLKNYEEQANSIFLLAIQEQQIVGELSLKGYPLLDLQHNTTLGLSVHRDWRRKGIGRQLLQAGIEWAQKNPLLQRIELFTYANNTAAIQLYQSLGFVQEGLRKRFICQDGDYIDDLMMALYL